MPKFCTFCGSELEPEMQFCAKCGGKVEKETPKESASPSQTAFAQPSPTIAPSSVPPPPVMPSTPTMPISPRPYPVGGSSTPLHLPENTKLADDGDRFLAYIIDGMIIGAIASSLQGLIYGWHGFNPMNFVWSNESYVSYGLSLLYYWGFEFLTKGRTLGKMLMRLRTVDEINFQPVSAFRSLLHCVGKVFLVPLDFIIGSIALDRSNPVYKSQVRITQRLSKTVVIKELRPNP